MPLLSIVIAQQLVLLPLYVFVPFWIPGVNFLALFILWFFKSDSYIVLLKWIKVLLVFLSIIAIFITYKTISGKTAGVALIAVMYGLKILEIKQKKQAMTLMSLSFFILATGFLFTQNPWIMFYQAIPIIAILNVLVSLNSLITSQPRKSYNSFVKVIKEFSIYLLFALPVMLVLFLFFPRLDSPLWRIPGMKEGISGVSDTMSPGEISDLQLSDEIAFRVKFTGPEPSSSSLYWRMLTMERFDGLTWSRGNYPLLDVDLISKRPQQKAAQLIDYVLSLEPTKSNYLVTLDSPITVSKQGKIFEDYVIKTQRKIFDRTRYTGRSMVNATLHQALSSNERKHHLKLPGSGNQKTRQWAKNHRALVNSDWEFIQFILKEINQKEFFYTLQPPIMDEDTQDSFWLVHQKGFCEHYASALVFIARAAGIPARVVVGYQGGDNNPLSDYWIVRYANAHAWTEIWFQNKGWVRVDPTSAIAPHRVEDSLLDEYAFREGVFDDFDFAQLETPNLFKKMSYWVDDFNHRWNDWVINYNRQQQLRNFHNWGLLGIKPSILMTSAIVIIFFFVLIFAYRGVKQKRIDDPLTKSFVLLERKLYQAKLISVQTSRGPNVLKKELCREGLIKPQPVIRLIDEYIKLRYQTVSPDNQQALSLLKRVKNLSLSKKSE